MICPCQKSPSNPHAKRQSNTVIKLCAIPPESYRLLCGIPSVAVSAQTARLVRRLRRRHQRTAASLPLERHSTVAKLIAASSHGNRQVRSFAAAKFPKFSRIFLAPLCTTTIHHRDSQAIVGVAFIIEEGRDDVIVTNRS